MDKFLSNTYKPLLKIILIHDNEPNYVWYDTWNAFKNGNSTDSENALVTIKNRLAGQDGLIPKMINASEFQLM